MNSVLENIARLSNVTTTANGDIAHKSTFNRNLDFFFGASTFMSRPELAVDYFMRAYSENRELAILNLAHLRDIKDGAGAREAYRLCLAELSKLEPDFVSASLNELRILGRWDDILHLAFVEEVKDSVAKLVADQFDSDIKSMLKGESVSLLAKWLPKVNSKSNIVNRLGYRWANILTNGDKITYRRWLKALRDHIDVLETRLTNKDYTFEYDHVPAKALVKYAKAFDRNDGKRYNDFRSKPSDHRTEGRVKKLFPHEVLRLLRDDREMSEKLWSAFDRTPKSGKAIVVHDSSGSMNSYIGKTKVRISDVADALAIYTSERLTGPFKDKIITFSREPQFVDLASQIDSLYLKSQILSSYSTAENTDIAKVYDLIFKASVEASKDDLLDAVIIITDCEFDGRNAVTFEGMHYHKSTFDEVKEKFENSGIPMPKLVYWNLNARRVIFPTTDLENAAFVSGYSANILNDILSGEEISGLKVMMSALDRYNYLLENLK